MHLSYSAQLDFFSENSEWLKIINNSMPPEEIIVSYFSHKIQFSYLFQNIERFSTSDIEIAVKNVIDALFLFSVGDIKSTINERNIQLNIDKSNIPQFSNFASAAIYVPELLVNSTKPYSYIELGYALFSDTKSEISATKYGENHGKMASLLDLAHIKTINRNKYFEATALTPYFCKLQQEEKIKLITRLCYRIPIIQKSAISNSPMETLNTIMRNTLSKSTYERRKSNNEEVLSFALEE